MNIIRSLQRKTECPFFYDYKTVQQALRFMRSHGCVQVPVVNQDGRYLGTVSEGDFLWHIIDWGGYEAAKDHKIAELLRRGAPPALKITASDDELRRAARLFLLWMTGTCLWASCPGRTLCSILRKRVRRLRQQ